MLIPGAGRAEDLVVVSLAPAQGVFRDAFDTFKANIEQSFGEPAQVRLLVGGEAGEKPPRLTD